MLALTNDPETNQDHGENLYEWPAATLQCEDLYDGVGVTFANIS